ncbi:carboxylesterase 1C-like isoform X2 [Ornithodoros turicata]|uniref:carboxylesterase 1C-like isoform X2 n=1 Tax=Ornithodoros turicata TaxID=34597 RepID=UPI003138A973
MAQDPASPVKIELAAGTIEGRITDVAGVPNTKVRAYQGVPFAQSTAGANRFKAPLPISEYPNKFVDATVSREGCTQTPSYTTARSSAQTTEDCLHLSIWSPLACGSEARAVVVLIANEWFEEGQDPSLLDGTHMAAIADVVVVVPNHRLGPFGFLIVNDTVKNAAMYDILEALRWVKKNIGAFGGNARRVTVVAHDAAALMTAQLLRSEYRQLTRLSRRLVLLGMGALTRLPRNTFESTRELSKTITGGSCNTASDTAVIECLLKSPVADIAKAVLDMKLPMRFVPVFKKSEHLLQGVQVLAGSTVNEGDVVFDAHIFPYLKKRGITDARGIVGKLLEVFVGKMDALLDLIMNHIKEEYDFDAPGYRGLKDIAGNLLFICPLEKMLTNMHQSNAEVYHYILAYKPKSSKWSSPNSTSLDQLLLLSGVPFQEKNSNSDDVAMSRKLIEIVTGFAKNGTPADVGGLQWPPYGSSKSLLINVAQAQVEEKWRSDPCKEINAFT